MKKYNPFHFDDTLDTYKYPIAKIVICVVIILLLIFRNHFYHIDHLIWKIIEGVFCVIVGYACILCIYISAADITVVHENKLKIQKRINKKTEECVNFSVEKVISFIYQNDIIDFEIVSKGEYLNIGASSDNRPGDSVFFDKLYYIGNSEYDNLESFMEELTKYSIDGQISVVSIDGVSPENYT